MSTKDFQRDLGQVKLPGKFEYLSKVKAGDIDGSVCFTFTSPDASFSIDFQVVTQAHSYPKSHEYLVYSTSDDSPAAVTDAVETVVALFPRISIHGLLTALQSGICSALQGSKFEPPEQYQGYHPVKVDDYSDHSDHFDHSDAGEPPDFDHDGDFSPVAKQDPSSLQQKIRQDLREVKKHGFKGGYLGEISGSIIISVASRIDELGIPEEAMDIWKVRPHEYFVLLLRYPRGYLDMKDLFDTGDSRSPFIQMCLGLCDSYKPSAAAAVMAFQGSTSTRKDVLDQQGTEKNKLRPLFIGTQLNRLLNERFMGIVRLRLRFGFSWTGAELFFQANQGKRLDQEDASSPEYFVPDEWATPPPQSLTTDHMADTGLALSAMSFPQLAMQFTLRHFVRCTEFCLVCFCKKKDDFEALKPYVCSNGLCLYQYITYGMGESLEHEIKSQPNVVDMLVSLAYTRAKAGALTDFPTGLGIRVPNVKAADPERVKNGTSTATWNTNAYPAAKAGTSTTAWRADEYYSAVLDPAKVIVSHQDMPRLSMKLCRKREPQITESHWIVIVSPKGTNGPSWHCRVHQVGSEHVELSLPLCGSKQLTEADVQHVAKGWKEPQEVKFTIYEKLFDRLNNSKKQISIVMLLDMLPEIDEMIKYLASQGPDGVLSSWHNRIPPAALDMLRWIVASNRSCIVQDDSDPEHLVNDMQGYIQFRLVQGAPDKEQRFLRAVDKHSATANHPTLFAWHGSALQNWHSILREGLHFDQIAHGRACGNGVYMSSEFAVSIAYCTGWGYNVNTYNTQWPQSKLNMTSAISLNEVVNAPNEFVCSKGCYVVAELDWIQPRYLFVGVGNGTAPPTNQVVDRSVIRVKHEKAKASASVIYEQDPKWHAHGPKGNALKIPISAINVKRREGLGLSAPNPSLTPKTSVKKMAKRISKRVASLSQSTGDRDEQMDAQDLKILLSDSDVEKVETPQKRINTRKRTERTADKVTPNKGKKGKKTAKDDCPATDFVPGTLKKSTLPVLAPPRYATSFATKVLQKQFQSTVKIQQEEKLHELGWYVDPDLISGNLYQWIVELHSFDSELPLAKDLKAAKQKSVVLELRFPPNYPMDPPFVRVIRPQFVPFHAGGGGHVTLGGALCMELLTTSGWTAVTSIESLLLQVRLAITSTDPQPARLEKGRGSYGVGAAIESYKRACMVHGWEIPKDMELMHW
ncbi:hypothetical protein PENDEC_c003G04068 [Penicillium decumbens]|uniref:UBC core domain-containing protein n=1 Tax=Penicillium decumbens TaxID=69771 RepID=A0A1V6PKM0_PENDC|nr:hypothetical protein PENDEC_c003G04068 [Penicillium decumbens]